ncbi:MAG TPA: NUDIX domain-containing protein [Candidatus Saccharimonadales bacterium]|nr:NUDIX domain-containing protein [Candidatus Saccharimonadales bacterium]
MPLTSRQYLEHELHLLRHEGTKAVWWHHYLHFKEGVMVALVDRVRAMGRLGIWVAMVDHWRMPVGRWSRELPSGSRDTDRFPGESLNDAAARELYEETGWIIKPEALGLLFPGQLYGSIGVAVQPYHVFEGAAGNAEWQEGFTGHDKEETGQLVLGMHRLEQAVNSIGREVVEPVTSASLAKLALKYGVT